MIRKFFILPPHGSAQLQLLTLTGAGTSDCTPLAMTLLPFHPKSEMVSTRLSGSTSEMYFSLRSRREKNLPDWKYFRLIHDLGKWN